MNLDRFIREVRPTGGVYGYGLDAPICGGHEEPVVLVFDGEGEVGAQQFADLASSLPYGTAVLFANREKMSGESLSFVEEAAARTDFREWHGAPGVPPDAYAWIRSFYDGATYSTHLPYLLKAVEITEGPVLELGAGSGSTPALHIACAGTRRLVTVDNKQEWLDEFTYLATKTHLLEHADDPAESPRLDEEWAVVFVDHAPGETRRRAIERARGRALYIVVHDSEDLGYGIEDVLSSFKYRSDFRRARPWTSVVSDTREVW